ncbi:MAG: type II secretion system protein GspG [Thermoanaerobaculia bacterium]
MDMQRRHERSSLRKGFTLLELIVVITIIGILGTLVVMRVTVWADKARVAKIKQDLQTIYRAAEGFKIVSGRWPTSLEELKTGTSGSAGGQELEALIENPKDPWGNEYMYEPDGGSGKPRVYCLGADGSQAGEGENKDYEWPETVEGQ